MAATEDIQTRKLISAYGGIGSIIESRQGALQILPFDKWPFALRECKKAAYRIYDERLLARLRSHFTRLDRLVRLPAKDGDNRFGSGLPSKQAAARYFPRWLYCSSCARFNDYEEWLAKWNNTVSAAERSQFTPPRCGWCYENPQIKGNFHLLEQVRFVMTSPGGHIADVPWARWALRNIRPVVADTAASSDDHDELAEGTGTRLDMQTPLPPGMTLRYRTAAKFGDLKGIIISAHDAQGKEISSSTLAGIFGLRVPEAAMGIPFGRGNVLMKAVLRSSTSVYYPNIVHSLYLPATQSAAAGLTPEMLTDLKELHQDETPIRGMQRFLQKTYGLDLAADYLADLISCNFHVPPPAASSPDEETYRQAEYNFITKQPGDSYRDTELIIEPVPLGTELVAGISALFRLDKLKLTSVQTSYTRQQPIERDAFLADNNADAQQVQRCYTTKFGPATYLLPAVESYGEGLFIELNAQQLARWETRKDVRKHVDQLRQNLLRLPTSGGLPRPSLERFVLLHTLSHLLIKELEFLCGYPATSLQERLYVGPAMQGILLYTIAGSEGSYGGLVSLGRRGELPQLIRSALSRARYDCAADPICWHTDKQGQGAGGLNLAACQSCALLPETSCEEFNSLLDRRLVVDPAFGFFPAIAAESAAAD
jgi:hypothetical protein